jgi:hypothetical protein
MITIKNIRELSAVKNAVLAVIKNDVITVYQTGDKLPEKTESTENVKGIQDRVKTLELKAGL